MEFSRTSSVAPEADAPTRARVVRSILERGPSTAAELAQGLDLTPAAVRRHLDHLVTSGTLESAEQRVYGQRSRGRPARVFSLTEAGRDEFDQHYDDLAVQALRFMRETQGDEAVVEFARRRVAFIPEEFERVSAAHPDLDDAEVLASVLTEGGYAAGVRSGPVGDQLCQQHCPVAHVAHEFPQLCEAETEAFAQVLGSHVQRLATIAHGDGVCTTCIPDPARTRQQTTSTTATEKDGS